MSFSAFATRDTLKLEAALKKVGKRVTVQTIGGSRKRFHRMNKTPGSADYHSNFQSFLHRLSLEQMEALKGDSKVQSVGAFHETGRKFDKVFIATVLKSGKTDREVRYFVRRSDGVIFGAKSPMAPNLKWYFGSIYEHDLWSWGGHHGVPLDFDEKTEVSEKTQVKLAGGYGDYKHFEPLDAKTKKALATT